MAATRQLSRITPYALSLLTDEYVQEQVGQALAQLRRSSSRAKGRRTSDALKDAKLRSQVSEALTSLGKARRAIVEPPRTRRRFRRALVVMMPLAAALVWQQRPRS